MPDELKVGVWAFIIQLWCWKRNERVATAYTRETVIKFARNKLVNNDFVEFATSLGQTLAQYSTRLEQVHCDLTLRLRERVSKLYFQRYTEFKDKYGLKLNYSIE